MTTNREFPLSNESFLYMKILASRCGIDISDYKQDALYNRLVKRMRVLDVPDFDTYCQKLRFDLDEEIQFINLITNTTTYFFRENHHFEYLAKYLVPELLTKKNKIRIWSVGCSTGEEAYSIAMVIREVVPNFQKYDIQILATDINTDALIAAQNGIYEKENISKLPRARRGLWFKDVNEDMQHVQIDESLKELITFNNLNLVGPWPVNGPFDVILCRNVIIYFKPEVSQRILNKFNNLLEVGGVLILGYSENINELKNAYVSLGNTIYKKILI